MTPTRKPALLLFVMLLTLLAACTGPRTKWFVTQHPAALPPETKVDVYVGKIDPPYQQIAIIETKATKSETNDARQKQFEELRGKAREVGANAIQDVQILQKRVKGWVPDPRTPFSSWQQGYYSLYFMRGTAIVVPERAAKTMSDIEPLEGWSVEKLPIPPPLPKTGAADTTGTAKTD